MHYLKMWARNILFLFQFPGKVVIGSTVDPLSTLPRANKVDPTVSRCNVVQHMIIVW